jgi:hypothetical protein
MKAEEQIERERRDGNAFQEQQGAATPGRHQLCLSIDGAILVLISEFIRSDFASISVLCTGCPDHNSKMQTI